MVRLTDLSLSCGAAPFSRRQAARRLPQPTKWSAGASCKRRDAVTLAMREAARLPGLRTARPQLQ